MPRCRPNTPKKKKRGSILQKTIHGLNGSSQAQLDKGREVTSSLAPTGDITLDRLREPEHRIVEILFDLILFDLRSCYLCLSRVFFQLGLCPSLPPFALRSRLHQLPYNPSSSEWVRERRERSQKLGT